MKTTANDTSKEITLDLETIDSLDQLVKKNGGNYTDWLAISLIKTLLTHGNYRRAFRLYVKTEFSTNEILYEATTIMDEALEELES